MRKRKRNWPIRVLKYRAYPTAVPQSVWDTATRQRALWNQLVEQWRLAADSARGLGTHAQNPPVGEPTLDWMSHWARRGIWLNFESEARRAVAASGLDWVNGPEVLDRFRASTSSKRRPHFHGALERVSICHRYTGGGIALLTLIDNPRASRFGLQSAPGWQPIRRTHSPRNPHWRGIFKVENETIDFSLALHRPLPPGAILKRVAWLGERVGNQWFWYLALTIEEPIDVPARAADDKRPVAAIDVGWRLFGDGTKHDYLRVGMLADSEGRMMELRLPLRLRPNRLAEVRGLDTIWAWQSKASNLIENAKALVGMAKLTGDAAQRAANPKLGRRGLGALLRDGALTDPSDADKLRQLLDAHDWIYQRIHHLNFRLIERRRWYYHNLALWLTKRYQRIAVEGMALPQLHARTDDPAQQQAAKYRNYAAVGEFRAILKRAAAQTGSEIVDCDPKDTTRICHLCFERAESGPALILTCPRGHEWDQDKNAARNLLSQIGGIFPQSGALRKSGAPKRWKPLEIPSGISAVASEVPAL